MKFIVCIKGERKEYRNKYNEDIEKERNLAWEDAKKKFPDADYIESFY